MTGLREWWQPLLELRFGDDGQQATYSHPNNIRMPLSIAYVWVTAFRKDEELGVMVSGRRDFDALLDVRRRLEDNIEILIGRLPRQVVPEYPVNDVNRFASVIDRRTFASDNEQRQWLRETIEVYMDVVEPIVRGYWTASEPDRIAVAGSRIVRDTALANEMKVFHEYTCQICGVRLETPAGPYAEGHHIRPLGGGHNGRDISENIIVVCPNCHIMCDRFAFTLDRDELTRRGRRPLGREYVEYHNDFVRQAASRDGQ